MSDASLRQLERAAASGDRQAWHELDRQAVRSGLPRPSGAYPVAKWSPYPTRGAFLWPIAIAAACAKIGVRVTAGTAFAS